MRVLVLTFLDFPEHCLVEKKKKDEFHSSDAKDIQSRKKKKKEIRDWQKGPIAI